MTALTHNRHGSMRPLRTTLHVVAVWIVVLVVTAPFLWTVLNSFKTELDAVQSPPTLFFVPTLQNYADVIQDDFAGYLTNSVVITLITTIATIMISFPLAFALAVKPIRGWRDVLFFLLSTRLMPIGGIVVPLYIVALTLGLLDTHVLLIVLYTGMNVPIAVWLLRTYLLEISPSVLEAARIDGAGTGTEMFRIALPMIAPSLAATAALVAIFAWNEFFLAVSLTSVDAGTLPVYLSGFQSNRGLFLAKLSAISVLASIPTIIIGWIAQRRLIHGFELGTDR
ncbi:carbohydrate ABC transporter permease [Microbacterium sp. UCD-TDU]|uniref:carbohydrate ABC transporter permease n=1 Tax=Microbacterium sp. UCD-TDU TaxID=1247714 RepID=UPI000345BA09|nr:carbohydrate ABC transporter permease [Microbacterium sp. UCD-TDU]EYT57295.1 mannitol ABC transporter permease [Microbacterium sp. UCD-TDU]